MVGFVPVLCSVHAMLKTWFKGCLAEILTLKDCLDNAKMTLNAALWPGCVNCV